MTDQEIRDALARDYSAGTEAFRDALLARCLAVLGSDDEATDLRVRDLCDEDLELLAAAGPGRDLTGAHRVGDG